MDRHSQGVCHVSYRSTGFRVLDQWFWIKDEEEVYFAGKLISYDSAQAKFEKIDGTIVHLPIQILSEMEPSGESVLDDAYDLMELSDFDLRQILHHLRKRFHAGKIYTEIGDILMVLNPQKHIEGLFTKEQMDEYKSHTEDTDAEPHIYGFAQKAYHMLKESKTSQSLIIAGESGSGATFTQHQIMEYFLAVVPNGMERDDLIQKIPIAISILECFGSASTKGHSQASKFGIWINLSIHKDTHKIAGCGFKDYLLDTQRLKTFSMECPKERSFDALELIRNQVEGSEECRFLPPPNEETAGAITMTFKDLKQKFCDLECNQLDIKDIMKILKAIIQIGRIVVENGRFDKKDKMTLEAIYALLGIDGEKKKLFQDMILDSKVQVTSRNIKMVSKQQHAIQMLDKTAQLLYLALFKYLFVNFSFIFRRDQEIGSEQVAKLGICNFPGFEVRENGNDFIQLMQSWAAERMDELYLRDIFNDELDVFKKEKVNVRSLLSQSAMQQTLETSWTVLAMIENPQDGMVSIIDQHTSQWRSLDSDDDELLRALDNALESNEYYESNGKDGFIISHFGGDTEYDITDFIKKNDAFFPKAMTQVFLESKDNEVLDEAVKFYIKATRFDRLSPNDQTFTRHFGNDLNDLMDRIRNSNPHYIRCFRINKGSGSEHFDSKLLYKQMQSAGMYHVVKVRNLGLPFRFVKQKFVKRYIGMHPDKQTREDVRNEAADFNKVTKGLVDFFWRVSGLRSDCRFQVGVNHVFMTDEMLSELERMRDEFIKKKLVKAIDLIKIINNERRRKSIITSLKVLKMGIRNQTPDQLEAPLREIRDLECQMDLKDAVLQHHLVLEAAKMIDFELPAGGREVEITESVEIEYVPDEYSAVGQARKRRGSTTSDGDNYRSSLRLLDRRLSTVVEESASTIAELEHKYQSKIDELQAQLKDAQRNATRMLNPEIMREHDDLRDRLDYLDDCTRDTDMLSEMGLSECPEMDGLTMDTIDIEPMALESRSTVKFRNMTNAVHGEMSDYNNALRVTQDMLMRKGDFNKKCERQQLQEELAVGGLERLNIGLDELNITIKSWADLGSIHSENKSVLDTYGPSSMVPVYMHNQNRLVMDCILRGPVFAAPPFAFGPSINPPIQPIHTSGAERVEEMHSTLRSKGVFTFQETNAVQEPVQESTGGLDLAVQETKALISSMNQKYALDTTSPSMSEWTERMKQRESSKVEALQSSHDSFRGSNERPRMDSDATDLVCMLLRNVDVVQDPNDHQGSKSSHLRVASTIAVDRLEWFGSKQYAKISQPQSGWIPTEDDDGNPNIPVFSP